MFFVLLLRESLVCDAGQSFDSPVSFIEIDCSSHIIKHLTTIDNNISIESILEQSVKTVHVFVFETECIQVS